MRKFSDRTPEEKHALFMKNLWDAELMFLEHPDSNDEFWSKSNREIMLTEHKKQMESVGLVSSAN